MKQLLMIKSVMHPFPHTISPLATLEDALDLMREHDIRHLPVRDGGQLVGILTERDVDFALQVAGKRPFQAYVSDAYVPDPYVVEQDTPVDVVAAKMADSRIGCVLVVQKDNRLIGIFTTVDACRTLAGLVSGQLNMK